MKHAVLSIAALAACLAFGLAFGLGEGTAAAQPASAADRAALRKVQGGAGVLFQARPATGPLRGVTPRASVAPVSVRFVSRPTAADLDALRALGAAIPTRRDGSPRGGRRFVAAEVPASALLGIARLPRVERVTLDAHPFAAPRPLEGTAVEVQAEDLWRSDAGEGLPLTGAGVTLCDIDSGIDVFHPLFFRADGGYFAWVDADGDGKLTPGVDGVDVDGDGALETLRILESPTTAYFDPKPFFGTGDPGFAAGLDWLYADVNESGARELGRAGGFDDATPAFGEPLFAADDVNGDGQLAPHEKIVRLATSKIRVYRYGSDVYRRGTDLVDGPRDPGIAHGTLAAGVLVAGQRGLSREVGMAPDAEVIMATDDRGDRQLQMTDFCIDEGARVVLHEYAPWMGYHLDGSSDLEQLIDETSAAGVSHINPAGNLSTSQKLYKQSIPAGVETVIDIDAPVDSPYGAFHVLGLSLLWRDTSRDLALVLEDPTGFSRPLGVNSSVTGWRDDLYFYSERVDSDRGTARVDVYVFGNGSATPIPAIPSGLWRLRVTEPGVASDGPLEVIGYVLDEASGWGKGIHFPDGSSEDHLIGYPGTADHGLAVSAYTGHGYLGGTPGERAYYSGRGHRIDGAKILSIAGPDDPISSGFHAEHATSYAIFGGTSGASPHVAGVAALLIQADPGRTGDDVRDAIRNGALVDATVGEAPNDDYGYGKLRAYRSLYGSDPPGGGRPSLAVAAAKVTVGVESEVAFDVGDPDEARASLTVEIDRDYDGAYDEALAGGTFAVRFDAPGGQVAKLRVTDSTGRQSAAIARIEVAPPVPAPVVPALGEALVAGGGCGVSGSSSPDLAWSTALLVALLRRRAASRTASSARAPG